MTVIQGKGFEMAAIGRSRNEIANALGISRIYAQWIIVQYEKLIGVRQA